MPPNKYNKNPHTDKMYFKRSLRDIQQSLKQQEIFQVHVKNFHALLYYHFKQHLDHKYFTTWKENRITYLLLPHQLGHHKLPDHLTEGKFQPTEFDLEEGGSWVTTGQWFFHRLEISFPFQLRVLELNKKNSKTDLKKVKLEPPGS